MPAMPSPPCRRWTTNSPRNGSSAVSDRKKTVFFRDVAFTHSLTVPASSSRIAQPLPFHAQLFDVERFQRFACRLQLMHAKLAYQSSLMDNADPIADAFHLRDQMARQEERRAGFPRKPQDQLANLGHPFDVQAVRRLVENEQI